MIEQIGPMKCGVCGREWVAAMMVATVERLECPGCGVMVQVPPQESIASTAKEPQRAPSTPHDWADCPNCHQSAGIRVTHTTNKACLHCHYRWLDGADRHMGEGGDILDGLKRYGFDQPMTMGGDWPFTKLPDGPFVELAEVRDRLANHARFGQWYKIRDVLPGLHQPVVCIDERSWENTSDSHERNVQDCVYLEEYGGKLFWDKRGERAIGLHAYTHWMPLPPLSSRQ